MTDELSLLDRLATVAPEQRRAWVYEEAARQGIGYDEATRLILGEWRYRARPKQLEPEGDDWTFWFLMSGRGFGKTLSAAEWVARKGREQKCRIAVVAPTFPDVRATCFEGEALALDTLVPTPTGYTTMGALRTGDTVIGGDGEPCRVRIAHPVLYDRDCFKVRLRGGVEIVADADHRWLTETAADREAQRRTGREARPRIITTREILATLKPTSGRSRANHAIRVAPAKYGAARSRRWHPPIDPYVLGAWLGDGVSKSGAVCDAEGDVVTEIEKMGYRVRLQPSSGTVPVYGVLGLQVQLRQLGVLRNKHVPTAYLRLSAMQRLALVQGLMDTDGYVSARGQCEFVSKRRQLADALVDLLCGLGIKASAPRAKRTKIGTTHYIVKFTTTLPVFRMRRKRERLPQTYRDAEHWRILSVAPMPSVPVRCITVDSPDKTYLVTRHHVRTHNTGLLSVFKPHELLGGNRQIAYNESLFELRLANGTIYKGFSAEVPNRLRGPQHHYAWLEEISSWADASKGDKMDTCWSNLKLGLRLGRHPRAVITSTPKANLLTRHLVALDSLALVRGSSYENRDNLSEIWWQTVVAPMEGTRTGRQEIQAELLDDVEGALWSLSVIDACRAHVIPGTTVQPTPGWQDDPTLREAVGSRMRRIIVGVDPNTTSGESADAAGVVVVGLGEDNEGYVLDDRTVVRGGPSVWRAVAVNAYHDWMADKIVAEVNNGGEMVDLVLKGYDASVPVEMVHASRGKKTRAEPVAALYVADPEHDKVATVHHVGAFPEMEDEMTTWTPADESPNRMDALVWGMTKLRIWQPPAPSQSGVARGDIPGIVEIGAGLTDSY